MAAYAKAMRVTNATPATQMNANHTVLSRKRGVRENDCSQYTPAKARNATAPATSFERGEAPVLLNT